MPHNTSAELYPVHSTLRPELNEILEAIPTLLIDKWNLDLLAHPRKGARSKLTRKMVLSVVKNYMRGAGVRATVTGSGAGANVYYVWNQKGRKERARLNEILERTGKPGIPDPEEGRYLEFLNAIEFAEELRLTNLQLIMFEAITHGREDSTKEYSTQVFVDERTGEVIVERILTKETIKTSKYPNPLPLLQLLKAIDPEHYATQEKVVIEDNRDGKFRQQVEAWREVAPVDVRIAIEKLIEAAKEKKERETVLELKANYDGKDR